MIKKLLLTIAALALVNPVFAAQHDYDITTLDADSGVAMRAAINSALQALASNNLGTTAPASPYAGMWWADTTTSLLKQRSADNLSWITKGALADTQQPLDAELTAIAGLTSAADKVPYFTGSGAAAVATLTETGRNLIDDASVAAQRTTLELSTGATATVTTSATDTTAGRLLKVGDFGLGDTAALATATQTNLDDYSFGANGAVYKVVSPTGLTAGTYLLRINRSNGANNVYQELVTMNVSTSRYERMMNSTSGVTAWVRVYDTGNILGTVSGTYAAPTGAIIQVVSDSAGRCTKFADGTMICAHSLTTATQCTTATSGWYRTSGDSWTYPVAFAAAPNVHTAVDGYLMLASQGTPTTTAVTAYALSLTSEPTTKTLRLTAVGRWL